jgi:transposase
MEQALELLDQVQEQIHRLEARILERVQMTPTSQLIQSIPGPAKILSIVIDREVGAIDRFPSPHHFASYSGLVPKLSASAGRAHYGHMVKQCNTYLKWAFRAASRSAAEGHRSRQRHRRSPRPPQLAAHVRRTSLREHPPAQRPFRRRRCHRSLSSGVDLLGSQEE